MRWGVVLWGLVALLVVVALLLAGRPPQIPTTYSAGPGGMEGLYELLQRRGIPVARRTTPTLPRDGALVAAGSGVTDFSLGDADVLRAWVGGGGTLVILGGNAALGAAFQVQGVNVPVAGAATPLVALPGLRGAGSLVLPGAVGLVPLAGFGQKPVTLYVTDGAVPVIVQLRVGRGVVDWVGSSQIWTNHTLALAPGNLALATQMLGSAPRVTFDEYWFGAGRAQPPTVPPLARAPLPLPRNASEGLLGLGLAVAAALWAVGWRRHPPRPQLEPAPSAGEPVRAYAELLFRVQDRGRGRKGGANVG
jgi:hypothetical protein